MQKRWVTQKGVLSAPSPTQNNIAEKTMILKTESVQQSTGCDDTDLSTVAKFAHLSPGRGGRSSHDMMLLILAGRLTADPVPPLSHPLNLSHSDLSLAQMDGNLRAQYSV